MTGISLFDVIGPNMVGPSSSHTAGAVSMALLARKIFYKEEKTKEQLMKRVDFTLYGSFAKTYKGHGTDRALMPFPMPAKKVWNIHLPCRKRKMCIRIRRIWILQERTEGIFLSEGYLWEGEK